GAGGRAMRLEVDVRVPGRGVDAAFEVAAGAALAIVGPNGAGKSTLVQAIAGLIDCSGAVTFDGRSLDALPPEHRRVGVVFQDYLLFPHLSVLENVAFGPRAQGRRDAVAEASGWLDRLGIAGLAARRPGGLSGGQAQRVALARALAAAPEVLLLDEPLAALDVEVRDEVRAELAEHLAGFPGVAILVTHDLEDVAAIAQDVLVLERGRITQRGTVRELIRAPATDYVERLVTRRLED
ncbi:MAG: ABC transporter ATP-binding protein, partial [Rhodoglobus sp.]